MGRLLRIIILIFFSNKRKINFKFSGIDMVSLWWMFYQSNSNTLFWVKPSQEKVLKGVKSENFPKRPLALVVSENNHYFS